MNWRARTPENCHELFHRKIMVVPVVIFAAVLAAGYDPSIESPHDRQFFKRPAGYVALRPGH
jgi:hypothetical protein